jgi:PEGA domain-containing protein
MGVTAGRVFVGALVLALAGCEVSLPHSKTPTVSMRMQGSPPDATVTIDDMYVGPLAVVAARGVALPVGSHRISVEEQGYFPWDKIVEAKDKPVMLAVTLVLLPD